MTGEQTHTDHIATEQQVNRQPAERYETPLPKQTANVKLVEEKATKHLEMMGFTMKTL